MVTGIRTRAATPARGPRGRAAQPAGDEAPAKKAPAGRAAAADVARALQASASELFASQNYATVTIKHISEATGVNASLIYYYFGSKEELFLRVVEAAVDDAFARFEAVKAGASQPEEIVATWIQTHITHFVMMQQLAKMSLDYANTRSRTARIDQAIAKFYDEESVVLERAIQAGIDSGAFRPVDPPQMSTFISTFLDGALFRAVMFPQFDHRRAIGHLREVVLQHLRA
ncbi:TetR family transcriptional regulator [Allostella vacuolata]|nr:TetR family transcriptional regulator [Stella vacuolata]